MSRCNITDVNVEKIVLEQMFWYLERMTLSKDQAAWIVGGVRKLEDCIAKGLIQAEKKSSSQNGKWKCNAAQVFRQLRRRT